MTSRAVYETAFDSLVTPVDPDSDSESSRVLEASRRLCTPEPQSSSQRPSPASSRSSAGSVSRRRKSPRSPALPLKKLFGQWACGSAESVPETPVDPPPDTNLPGEDKSAKTFSPSVEFKKLDVADEATVQPNLNEVAALTNQSETTSSRCHSNNLFCHASTSNVFDEREEFFTNGHEIFNHESSNFSGWASRQETKKQSRDENYLSTNSAYENERLNSEMINGNQTLMKSTFQLPRTSREDMKRTNLDFNSAERSNLWLDFNRAPKRQRRHLFLDIKAPNNEEEDKLEPTKYLLKQEWYHGSISRADAEDLLRFLKKGSFLVRCSEKLKRQYLLSLKSSRGVMHVKIVQSSDGKYVIKQQSQSFDSVPQLVQYFSAHVLHIHDMSVYLANPVPQNLL